jgi:hypothetical protein
VDPGWCFAFGSDLISDVIDRSKVKLGHPLPGYRFKPGECIVNSGSAEEFRQGKCSQKELGDMKMLVVEVGVEKLTQNEGYHLLYCSTAGGEKIPWNQIDHWRSKSDVESMFERCDPDI